MNTYEYSDHDPLGMEMEMPTEGRLTVRNILSSYHGNYDLYAEAVQNAVDAVHLRWIEGKTRGYNPHVLIAVDLRDNTFTVIDNGVGIAPTECLNVFAPNYSLKTQLISPEKPRLRGHKGVGATFLAYGFDRTEIASKDGRRNIFTGRINNARAWANGQQIDSPRPLLKRYTESSREFIRLERGTLVRVKCGPNTHPARLSLYGTDVESWEGILRAETAVGMIDAVLADGFSPKVTLRLIQADGSEAEHAIQPSYMFPHELDDRNQFLDMGEYVESGRGPEIHRRDTNKLGIFRTFTDDQIRSEFDQLPTGNGPAQSELWMYVFRSYSAKFFTDKRDTPLGKRMYPGVRIASDSMPIGSTSNMTQLRRFTYSANTVHMLLHVEDAEPDIGRKGFSEEVDELGQTLAKELVERKLQAWNQFLRAEGSDRRVEAALENWKFDSRTHQAESPLPDWPGKTLKITSIPRQEQDVIALFHELLGAQAILGFEVLSTNQHSRYDSLAWTKLSHEEQERAVFHAENCPWGVDRSMAEEWTTSPIIQSIEYKTNLMNLVGDLRAGRKSLDGMDLAIAWTSGDSFEQRATDFNLAKLEFPRDLALRRFPGQTHELREAAGQAVLAVMLLDELFAAVGT